LAAALALAIAGAHIPHFVAAAPSSAAPRPQYGAVGFDATGEDRKTAPGDDFFRFANGGWVDRTEIPGDKPAYSLRAAITDQTEQRLHELLESASTRAGSAPSDITGKCGAFYRSFMDEARVEQLGARALADPLAAVRAARDRSAIAALMGRGNLDFLGDLFSSGIAIDLKDP
jgi:putative endopeptidase